MAAVAVQSFLLLTITSWFIIFTSAAHVPITAAPAVSPSAAQISPPEPKVLPSAAPPSGHEDIVKILEKAGGFTVLIRLMRSSHVADQINSQLKDANDGLTVFAPTDGAFGSLMTGALNKLSDKEQVELMQYHVVPTFLTMSQFETVSNPLMTKAGGSRSGEFPLNVTTDGDKVTLFTDTNQADVESTVYVDNKLAVYQVDKVLLPRSIFPKSVEASAPAAEPKQQNVDSDTNSATNIHHHFVGFMGVVAIAVAALFL